MRILITQRELINRGGSEMVTIDVARALAARGHDVAVYSPRLGDLSKQMLSRGVWPRSRLSEVPWTPDVIHGHHHLAAMAALSYFDRTPAIYYCHGVAPWVERPPLHPRIRRYVMTCEWMVRRVTPEYGISADRVSALPNFVDTVRFSIVRAPPTRIGRALLFGGGGSAGAFSSDDLQRLEAACAAQGLSLDRIGPAFGNPQPRPEVFLPTYDVVFAIGRSAIEAVACGCALIPILSGQAGHLVTPDNLEVWSDSNFSPVYFTAADQVTPEWLAAELRAYSPVESARLTEKVRTERTLERAVDELESLYAQAIADHEASGDVRAPREFAEYLEAIAGDADKHWADLCTLSQQSRQAELFRQQADAARREADHLRQQLGELHAAGQNQPWHELVRLMGRKVQRRLRRTFGPVHP